MIYDKNVYISSYDIDARHNEKIPTYYANTNLFSRRFFRRRPRMTGMICKEVLNKDEKR